MSTDEEFVYGIAQITTCSVNLELPQDKNTQINLYAVRFRAFL